MTSKIWLDARLWQNECSIFFLLVAAAACAPQENLFAAVICTNSCMIRLGFERVCGFFSLQMVQFFPSHPVKYIRKLHAILNKIHLSVWFGNGLRWPGRFHEHYHRCCSVLLHTRHCLWRVTDTLTDYSAVYSWFQSANTHTHP